MATTETPNAGKGRRSSLVLGVILAVLSAAGGYFAATSGMLPFSKSGDTKAVETSAKPAAFEFVEIEPMLVPLGNLLSGKFLRFRAELEVAAGKTVEVESVMPRIVDVLNGYLRALEREDLEKRGALVPLRANLLRRIQTVVGPGLVKDLLIMEFVVN